MADLTPQITQVTGTQLTAAAATATVGDWVPVGSYVTVRNGSGASINVTIANPGNDAYGSAKPDPVKAVPAGQNFRFGPFPSDLGDPSHSNMVNLICSAVTTVTLEVTF